MLKQAEKIIESKLSKINELKEELNTLGFNNERINKLISEYNELFEIYKKNKTMQTNQMEINSSLHGIPSALLNEYMVAYNPYDKLSINKENQNGILIGKMKKQLDKLCLSLNKIINTLHYAQFHINELHLILNEIQAKPMDDDSIKKLLYIINRIDTIISIYTGICFEIIKIDPPSTLYDFIDDEMLIGLINRVIMYESNIRGFSILKRKIAGDRFIDKTLLYDNENSIKLTKK